MPQPLRCRVGEDLLLGEGRPPGQEVGPDVLVDGPLTGLDTNAEDEGEDDDVLLSNEMLIITQ